MSEESTIFSAPSHNPGEKPKRPHMVRNCLVALLILAVVAAGTYAVIRLIPTPEEDPSVSDITLPVVSNDVADIAAFTITNDYGTIRCTSEVQENGVLWILEGVDSDLTNSASIGSTAGVIAKLSALRKMEDASADYGLNTPRITVSVEGRNGLAPYTILVGNEAPDKSGSYVQVQGQVYLVEQAVIAKFAVKDTDFAALTAFRALKETGDTATYFEGGVLTTCDSMTLTNRNLSEPIVFVPNDAQTGAFVSFLIRSPIDRLANNADALFRFAAEDTACAGAYLFHPTDDDLQRYGFGEPIASLTIRVGRVTRTILVSQPPEDADGIPCYAAIDENRRAIYKIPASTLTFADAPFSFYYSKYLTLHMLSQLSGFIVQAPDKTYSFGIVYDPQADSGKDFTITIDGKSLDQANFQSFYQFFVALETVSYDTEDLDDVAPALTISLKQPGSPDTVMVFKPASLDRRYQVEVDGNRLGMITQQLLTELLDRVEKTANNQPA